MAKIAVLLADYFEDSEYSEPADALEDDDHELIHIGISMDEVEGKEGSILEIDKIISEVDAEDFDALFIPGGFSPDKLREDEEVVEFVRDFVDSEKPVFAICHGPQILITADRVKDRTLTAYKTVQVDLKHAGANVLDQEVVEDKNLITSRDPDDLEAFIERMTERITDYEEKLEN